MSVKVKAVRNTDAFLTNTNIDTSNHRHQGY